MVPNDADDFSFAQAMSHLGVEKLPDRQGKPRQRSSVAKTPRTQRGRTPVKSQQAKHNVSVDADAKRELEELRRQVLEERAAREQLEKQHIESSAHWQRERAELEDAWQRERVKLEDAWQSEREMLASRWQSERNSLAARDAEQRQQLSEAQDALSKRLSLREALGARGCVNQEEMIAVLRGLLQKRSKELLSAGAMSDNGAFTRLLDQRVAFVADGVDMDDEPTCVVVRVPPERCEITGGSDIQAGYRRFLYACRNAKVRHVTIVGGSPAYRRQLKRLAKRSEDQVKLTLVSGTQRRTRKRAEADMRSSQLVVIWGATELDHSVSAVYVGAPKKLVRVCHRGISRMFLYLADELERRTQ